jgi:1-acyl-sn-glycerol-3-phosphate acyltransferase
VYVYGGMAFFFLLYLLLVQHVLRLWHWKDAEARQRFLRTYMRKVVAGMIRTLPYATSQRIFVNAGPDTFAKPGVIVSNHQSNSDIFMVLALPGELVMMVKDWVWNTPLMGPVVQEAGYLPVNRLDTDSLMQQSADLLKRGISIAVFPEGTRSPGGTMRRFHMGAFELAVRTKADIIPVLLTNTWDCIPWHAFWIGEHCLVVRALPRVTPDTFDYSQGARAVAAHVKEKMQAHVETDWWFSQAGPAFWSNLRSLYRYRGIKIEREVARRLHRDPLCKRIDGLVPETGTVLEVGCGYGLLANLLAAKSPRRTVIGIDSDPERIRVAQQSVQARSTATFTRLDASRDSLPEAGAVLAIDALTRWPAAQQKDVIARICACALPGGIVLFRNPIHRTPRPPRQSLPEEDYVSMFEGCGLTLEKEYPGMGPGSTRVLLFRKGAT